MKNMKKINKYDAKPDSILGVWVRNQCLYVMVEMALVVRKFDNKYFWFLELIG